MEINKGPDWTAAQFTAGAIGFVASAAVAHLLVSQGYATRNWAVILIAIGLCVPPTIVRWLDVKKRQKNRVP
jgi:uncharacterized membrane protein